MKIYPDIKRPTEIKPQQFKAPVKYSASPIDGEAWRIVCKVINVIIIGGVLTVSGIVLSTKGIHIIDGTVDKSARIDLKMRVNSAGFAHNCQNGGERTHMIEMFYEEQWKKNGKNSNGNNFATRKKIVKLAQEEIKELPCAVMD